MDQEGEATMSALASTSEVVLEPIVHEPVVHGGRLDEARKRFPDATQPWMICPPGSIRYVSDTTDSQDAWNLLPTPTDQARLCDAAASRYGVSKDEVTVAAPVRRR